MLLRLLILVTLLGVLAWLVIPPVPPRTVEAVMEEFMAANEIPGGVVAYGQAGQRPTVLAFGTMRADDVLPIASISKPITSEGIFALVDAGLIELDAPLELYVPEVASAADPRYSSITIRHLLQHSGGWDRTINIDPLGFGVAARAGLPSDASDCRPIALAMLSRQLDFAPGSRGAYSNLGYCWLGIVIERVSGRGYEDFIKAEVLRPVGLGEMSVTKGPARIYGASAAWEGNASDIYTFMSQELREEASDAPIVVAGHMPVYGLGWMIIDGGHGHFGRLLPPVDVQHIAFRMDDGRVIVAMFNHMPMNSTQAYADILAGLLRVTATR